jgi:hypothetical protein
MLSDNTSDFKYNLTWLGLDHANVVVDMEVDGSKEARKVRLKDWVLLTERFQERARRVTTDTIIDHIPRQVDRELVNRREIDRSRGLGEIEKEIDVTDKEEGITNAHVLMVVLNRVEAVQRKVQLEYCKERRAALDRIKSDLKVLTERLVEVTEGSEEEIEIVEKLEQAKLELREDSERLDEAARVRIRNFELDKTGKNNAHTFQVARERRSKRQIRKLIVDDEEFTDPVGIIRQLELKYKGIVGHTFDEKMSLDDFIEKYDIQFDRLEEADWMSEAFTSEEVLSAIKNAAKNAAPGPSGHTPSLYSYIFSEIPRIFTDAINELIHVPELIKAPIF